MKKLTFLPLFLVIIFCLSFYVSFANNVVAAVVINEIMYDVPSTDTDREWLEVFNDTADTVDLTGWKLFEANVNHGLTVNQGSANIPAGGYAVIVDNPTKFLVDWPGFSGTILDSSFSLNNNSESLVLKNGDGTVIDEVTYSSSWGAGGDGNSLQRPAGGGTWLTALPTPGALNATSSAAPPDNNNDNQNDDQQTATSTEENSNNNNNNNDNSPSAHSSSTPLSPPSGQTKFTVDVGRKRLVAVGAPVEFVAKVPSNVSPSSILWTFGDGSSNSSNMRVSHTYLLPGTYHVVLNASWGIDQAVSRTIVEVAKPDLTITAATPELISLKNSSKQEINLGGWILSDGSRSFIFPKDTIVAGGGQLNLPGFVTQLLPLNKNSVSLAYPDGRLALGTVLNSSANNQQVLAVSGFNSEVETESELMAILETVNTALAKKNIKPNVTTLPKLKPGTVIPTNNQSQLAAVTGIETETKTIVLDDSQEEAGTSWWWRIFKR